MDSAALLDDLRLLVDIESPTSDPAAMNRSADAVAAMGARLLGLEPRRLVHDGVPHLSWTFGDTGPTNPNRVLLLCHHDTVWPLGSWGETPVSRMDAINGEPALRGPGTFDMKAGIVQAMHALAALQQRGVELSGVELLITGDEETGSGTSRALIESAAKGCAAVFVLEASADGGALKSARKGVSIYRLEITGVAAHAGLDPEKGVSATVELAHQILRIAQLGDSAAGTLVTPTVLHAGTTINTVPAAGSVSIDVRAWTATEQERIDAALRSLTAVLPGARVVLHGGINRPPLELAMSQGLLALAQEVQAGLGLPPLAAAAVGGASDGNFTAGIGVPTLDGLGPVGGGAHAPDEHVLVGRMPGRTALLGGLIEAVLAGGVM